MTVKFRARLLADLNMQLAVLDVVELLEGVFQLGVSLGLLDLLLDFLLNRVHLLLDSLFLFLLLQELLLLLLSLLFFLSLFLGLGLLLFDCLQLGGLGLLDRLQVFAHFLVLGLHSFLHGLLFLLLDLLLLLLLKVGLVLFLVDR